ncbi:MAG: hypothetical protein K2P77_05065 [Burkholderiaceae bacterium]|nr:hypothetical protein [Burkholderiaceae bacterium]
MFDQRSALQSPTAVLDTGIYEVICPLGHKSINIIQEQKFEILFQIGAHAIIDGYYREGVSSFAASLERTYEFFIKTLYFSKGKKEEFKGIWKSIGNSSERQLGAFILLFGLEFSTPVPGLNKKNVEFRNDVIHKGIIPTEKQAIEYGQAVLDCTRAIIEIAKKNFADAVQQTIVDNMQSMSEKIPQSASIVYSGLGAILSIATERNQPFPTLAEELENLRSEKGRAKAL